MVGYLVVILIMSSYQLLPNAFSEIFMQAITSHKLTLADRYGLAVVLCNALINEEEKRAIDRILHGVRRGHIQLVDDLATPELPRAKRLKGSFHPNRFNVHKFMNSVNAQLSTKTRSLGAAKR